MRTSHEKNSFSHHLVQTIQTKNVSCLSHGTCAQHDRRKNPLSVRKKHVVQDEAGVKQRVLFRTQYRVYVDIPRSGAFVRFSLQSLYSLSSQ